MTGTEIVLTFHTPAGPERCAMALGPAIIAGWTGRDPAAVEAHIAELERLGVARPATTPIFYRVASSRLTAAPALEMTGDQSSGEVEFLLLQRDGRLWVGVGSDHTDRRVEAYDVTVSKQMCDKPIATEFWPMDDVAPHWDRLILRSHVIGPSGARVLYQQGELAAMLPPADLLARWGAPLQDGTIMYCGTFAVHGGIRAAGRFEYEIEDPVLHRTIAAGYDVLSLPTAR